MLDQGRLVEHAAARQIDQERRGLHRRDHVAVDEVMRFLGVGHQQHQEVGARGKFLKLAPRMHLVEMRRAGAAAAHADHGHAEQLAALGEMLGQQTQADDDDGLAFEDRLAPLLPFGLGLVEQVLFEVARQRDHVEEGKLAHLRAVDAAGRGQQHVRRQHARRRQRLGAGGQRLHPFQVLGLGDQRGRNVMAEPEDHVDVGNDVFDVLDVVSNMELHGRKALRQQRAILRPSHVENENLCRHDCAAQLAPVQFFSMSPCASTYCRNQTV